MTARGKSNSFRSSSSHRARPREKQASGALGRGLHGRATRARTLVKCQMIVIHWYPLDSSNGCRISKVKVD